jgi:hypothetical protein
MTERNEEGIRENENKTVYSFAENDGQVKACRSRIVEETADGARVETECFETSKDNPQVEEAKGLAMMDAVLTGASVLGGDAAIDFQRELEETAIEE